MAWAKVDDKLFSHPKWLSTPKGGKALWVSALSWCAGQGTDGVVPAHVLTLLGGTKRDANDLVRSGLWEKSDEDSSYRFHDWVDYQPDSASQAAKRRAESDGGKRGMHTRWHTKRGLFVPGCKWCEEDGDGPTPSPVEQSVDKPPYEEPYSPLNTPYPARTRTRNYRGTTSGSTPSNAREPYEPEPHPQPEMSVNAILASAGLARGEVRDFLVDLKGSGTRSTTALVNALHRDGRLPGRIAEWRNERNLAAEAVTRPRAGRRTTDDRVSDGFALAEEFRALEREDSTVVPLRQIEGA